jgi:hypothetical protein
MLYKPSTLKLIRGHHPFNLKSANAKKAIAQNCEPPRLHTEVKSVGDSVHDNQVNWSSSLRP